MSDQVPRILYTRSHIYCTVPCISVHLLGCFTLYCFYKSIISQYKLFFFTKRNHKKPLFNVKGKTDLYTVMSIN